MSASLAKTERRSPCVASIEYKVLGALDSQNLLPNPVLSMLIEECNRLVIGQLVNVEDGRRAVDQR